MNEREAAAIEPAPHSFDPTRALPAAAYRDPAWLTAEKASIWHGDWVFAATEDALAAPGDQLPILVGDQPVLLLRNQCGDLAALSNLCAHRGTLLVEERANGARIQCPYHAWTYDDAGRLIGVPHAGRSDLDRASHCLPRYRVESWHGLVFVSLKHGVEPLATRFAAIELYVAARGIGGLRHAVDFETKELWECNWKVAIMNAMESYHLFKVHPETLEPYAPTSRAYYVAGSARATATGGASKGDDDYLLISLPPGFVGVISRGSFVWLAVSPAGAQRCTVRTGGAYPVRPALERPGWQRAVSTFAMQVASALGLGYGRPDFLPEDKAICERVQRGIGGDFAPGTLLPVERVVADFGHYLNWRLNDVEPPAPRRVRAP